MPVVADPDGLSKLGSLYDPARALPPTKPSLTVKDIKSLDPKDGEEIWQAKMDGGFLYYLFDPAGIRAFSWRRSKRTGEPIEHTFKIHGLTNVKVPEWLHGAVISGEAWAPGMEARQISGILNSRGQPNDGSLRGAIHGITRLPGVSIEHLTNHEKVRILKRIAKEIPVLDLPDTAVTKAEKEALLDKLKKGSHGQTREGLVVIPRRGAIGKAVFSPTHDVPIHGVTRGAGKYTDRGIGAILVGSPESPTHVGTGLSDRLREVLHRDPTLLNGLVAKIEAKEVFPSGKFRAPAFKGFHPEKSDPDALARLEEVLGAENYKKSSGSHSRAEAIKYINESPGVHKSINIQVRKGEFRNPGDVMPYPFTYGEVPGLTNASDGDPWDVALMPGHDLGPDLKVVGYIPSKKTGGNDKLLLGIPSKVTDESKNSLRKDMKPLDKFLGEAVFFEAPDHKNAAMGHSKTAEYAPGIPDKSTIAKIPSKSGDWELTIHLHKADKAGEHYDLRLADPDTGQAHSWALPKATLPDETKRVRLAIQQPTHTMKYMDFEGKIEKGTYGAGTVEIAERATVPVDAADDRVAFDIPGKGGFVLRRQKGDQWLLLKKASPSVIKTPGEFTKRANIRLLLAALAGSPIVGAAYGSYKNPDSLLTSVPAGALGGLAGGALGAGAGVGLSGLLHMLAGRALSPSHMIQSATLGSILGSAGGGHAASSLAGSITGRSQESLLSQILDEIRGQRAPEIPRHRADLLR